MIAGTDAILDERTMWQRGTSWLCSLWIDGVRRVRSFRDRAACAAAEARNVQDRALIAAGLITWEDIRRREARRTTVAEALEDLLTDLERRGRSQAYLRDLRAAIGRVLPGGTMSVGTIDAAVIRERVARLGRTPRTRNRYLGAAKALTAHAVRHGWIDRDPLAPLRREPVAMGRTVRPVHALPAADALRLLDEHQVRESGRRLWYAVRLTTGLRATEAARILRRDLITRPEGSHLVVRAEAAKTGQPRILPMPAWVASEVLAARAWLPEHECLLRPVTARTQVRDARRAGIHRRVLPAALRLSWDVWLDELGVPVEDQMLLAGRTGTGGAAITRWVYQDLEAALPRLRSHVERVGEYLRHGRTDAPISHLSPRSHA